MSEIRLNEIKPVVINGDNGVSDIRLLATAKLCQQNLKLIEAEMQARFKKRDDELAKRRMSLTDDRKEFTAIFPHAATNG